MIIAIDSMDRELLHQFLPEMPNIAKIIQNGIELNLKSTLPPDSVTAWASIYTGMNPAEHGMVYFADPLDKIEATVVNEVDPRPIIGKTFWDLIGDEGKRVCIINPHLGFPPWKVNGIMTGRSNIRNVIECYPKDIISKETMLRTNIIREIPTRITRQKRIQECKNLIQSELEISKIFLNMEKWDVFMIYTSVLDYIEHYFWSFYDIMDPSYPGKNQYENVIKQFYILYDEFIGEISKTIDEEQEIIILSDHGHGMRPKELINFNILLEKEGLLKINISSNKTSNFIIKAKEMTKRLIKKAINEFGLGNLGMRMLKTFPRLRRKVMISSEIDWDSTIAYVSDQSGMKAYSYGGIMIQKERIQFPMTYEKIREKIIRILKETKYRDTNANVVKWCGRREDLYLGENIEKYPDVVATLKEGLGFGWSVSTKLFTFTETQNIAPGSHKIDTPVLILSKKHSEYENLKIIELDNVFQIIMQLSGN